MVLPIIITFRSNFTCIIFQPILLDSIYMESSFFTGAMVSSYCSHHHVTHNRAKYLLSEVCSLVEA